MPIDRFEDLEAWRRAHELVLNAYRASSPFPRTEMFGLTSQLRRAAISVPANIAEGFKRRTKRDKVHFYNISQGSLEELRYYWILAHDLKYIRDIRELMDLTDRCGRLLHGLIASIEQRK
ncbi:MAG TPA: four helix bundle protein [Pirellulales bacterium]|nr:four helix bundle protein [Pirellulales bacterium]